MNRLARTLGSIAASAVITCACAVAVSWPSTTEADDFAMPAEGIGVDTTVVGSVEVTAALVQDPAAGGGGWSLELKARNTSSEVCSDRRNRGERSQVSVPRGNVPRALDPHGRLEGVGQGPARRR